MKQKLKLSLSKEDGEVWYNSNRIRALLIIAAVGALEALVGSSELTKVGPVAVAVVGLALHWLKNRN